MKIRLAGLSLELNPALSLAEFIAELSGKSGAAFHWAGSNRILTAMEHSGYIIGSFVTIKDQSTFTQIDLESGKVSVAQLEKGKNLAGFNFFVISKKNLNGLYSHNPGSSPMWIFGNMLDSVGRSMIAPKRREALRELKDSGKHTEAKEATIRTQFAYGVKWTYLVSKENLPDIVKDWEKLRALQFTVKHLEPGEQDYGGLKPYVRARTTRLAFESQSTVASIRKLVLRYLKTLDYDDAKIEGIDEAGNPRRIDVVETRDWFGDFDYEAVLKDPNLFSDDVRKSHLIQAMLQEAKVRPQIFNIDVK
jgi:hypothetical protein